MIVQDLIKIKLDNEILKMFLFIKSNIEDKGNIFSILCIKKCKNLTQTQKN